MQKTTVILIFTLFLLITIGSFLFLTQTSVNNLLTFSSDVSFGKHTNGIALWYLKNSKKIKDFSLDDETPLHLIFRGCSIKDQACKDTAEWLLKAGANIDQISAKTGTTVLHDAVLRCDPYTAEFIIAKQANTQIRSINNEQKSYDNSTPFELFKLVRGCSNARDLYSVLNKRK